MGITGKLAPRDKQIDVSRSSQEYGGKPTDAPKDASKMRVKMLRDIPRDYSRKQLESWLNEMGMKGKYCYLCLVLGEFLHENRGYAFIIVDEMYESTLMGLNGKSNWPRNNSGKQFKIDDAHVQGGLDMYIKKDRNSSEMHESFDDHDDFRPALYDMPSGERIKFPERTKTLKKEHSWVGQTKADVKKIRKGKRKNDKSKSDNRTDENENAGEADAETPSLVEAHAAPAIPAPVVSPVVGEPAKAPTSKASPETSAGDETPLPGSLRIRNTFIEIAPLARSPSLKEFFQDRAVRSCPSEHIGRLAAFRRN